MVLLNLLELVTKEYLSIVESLLDNEPVENNRIVIEREHFRKLLEKYKYMTFKEKTRIYKDLNFIIHDKNNYTLPYKDHTMKKTVRKVAINYQTFLTVKKLIETHVN